MINLRSAAIGAATAVAAVTLLVGGEAVKPVENVVEPVFAPAESHCLDGWEYTDITQPFPARTCSKDGIVATLAPNEDLAERCLNTRDPNAQPVSCINFGWPEHRLAP